MILLLILIIYIQLIIAMLIMHYIIRPSGQVQVHRLVYSEPHTAVTRVLPIQRCCVAAV